jgi:hypothetical protein
VTKKLASGELKRGILRVNPYNRDEGYVTVETSEIDILIKGRKNQNRSFDGDEIAFEIFPEDQWEELKESQLAESFLDDIVDEPIIGSLSESEESQEQLDDDDPEPENTESPTNDIIIPNNNKTTEDPPSSPNRTEQKIKRPTGKVVYILDKYHERRPIVGFLSFPKQNNQKKEKRRKRIKKDKNNKIKMILKINP